MLDKIMKSLSGHPAAPQLKAIAEAEQRAAAIVAKLEGLHRQRREATEALERLQPADLTADADLDSAAADYVRRHAELQARATFAKAAARKLAQELADARRSIITAEQQAERLVAEHFHRQAADRASKLAASIRGDLEALAAELSRAEGWPVTAEQALAAVHRAGWPNGYTCTVGAAESATSKIPPVVKSTMVTGEHRSGRGLDRLHAPTPGRDAAVLRRQLEQHQNEIVDTRRQLAEAERMGQHKVAEQRREYLALLEQTDAELRRDLERELLAELETA